MARDIKIRLANPDDVDNILEWCNKDGFDPATLLYPRTDILCAENSHPLAFLPVQVVCMLETLGLNPDNSKMEGSRALYYLIQQIERACNTMGIKELYFLGNHDKLNKVAEHYGFELMPYACYRLKVRNK